MVLDKNILMFSRKHIREEEIIFYVKLEICIEVIMQFHGDLKACFECLWGHITRLLEASKKAVTKDILSIIECLLERTLFL